MPPAFKLSAPVAGSNPAGDTTNLTHFRALLCGKAAVSGSKLTETLLTLIERSSIMVIMNKLSADRRAKVISALVEGNSIRATCRMTGTAKGTVTRLLTDLGKACYT